MPGPPFDPWECLYPFSQINGPYAGSNKVCMVWFVEKVCLFKFALEVCPVSLRGMLMVNGGRGILRIVPGGFLVQVPDLFDLIADARPSQKNSIER